MDAKNKKKKEEPWKQLKCATPCCFFCTMKEQDPCLRRAGIVKCFVEMPFRDDQEFVLVLSGLWHIAMTQPNYPEFPTLGIFECMAKLIYRGLNDRDWLHRDQNMYIPYYAAHIIGSYTISVVEFAEKAVHSGVIPPLMELMRGKISWVEQRVAVRALGHLVSYERTFDAVAEHEEEIVELAMQLASTCLDVVYVEFVGVKDVKKRLKYQCDLLTRGMGGLEMENRKAEEWASQLQCWSLYLLNCFACKERSLDLICKQWFLKDLCNMWGGLVNDSSPAGVGLIRILCYSKIGRRSIADTKEVIETLCNLSRSSDDYQYIGIDCLLLLLKDPDTRYKVIRIAAFFLKDLVELRNLEGRKNVGEAITQALLLDYKDDKADCKMSKRVERVLKEIWDLKVEKRKREEEMSKEEVQEKRVLMEVKKKQGNERFWSGKMEEAVIKYTEALDLCPLKMRKDRLVLHSNRAQCYLLLGNTESAISDATKALCLSNPANSHNKSLWRRSQAYDMKALAKESLMDCIMFLKGCFASKERKRVKVPHYAARMINKQMNATWLFAGARCKKSNSQEDGHGFKEEAKEQEDEEVLMKKNQRMKEKMAAISSLPTIREEPVGRRRRRKLKRRQAHVRSRFY